jgi:hypothetical protein
MKSKALRGLGADARQLPKLLDEPFHGFGKTRRHG